MDIKSRRKLHEKLMKTRSIQLLRSSTPDISILSPALQKMPDKEELMMRFCVAMENLDVKGESKQVLESYTDKQKWNLICINDTLEAKQPVSYYISQIRKRLQIQQQVLEGKKIKLKISDGNLLNNLEISLKTNSVEWVKDFLSVSNGGLDIILSYLSCALDSIRYDMNPVDALTNLLYNPLEDSTKKLTASSTMFLNRKPSGKVENAKERYFSIPSTDIVYLVKCVKAIMNHSGGFKHVFSHPRAINILVLCLRDRKIRTKILVLNLIAVFCFVDEGHNKILNAFNNFKRIYHHDTHRFSYMVDMLKKMDDPPHVELLTSCLSCINLIVHSANNMNLEVYLQQEFLDLDFDKILENLKSLNIDMLNNQIDAYKENYIDVRTLKDIQNNSNYTNNTLSKYRASRIEENLNKCKIDVEEKTKEIEKLNILIDEIREENNVLKADLLKAKKLRSLNPLLNSNSTLSSIDSGVHPLLPGTPSPKDSTKSYNSSELYFGQNDDDADTLKNNSTCHQPPPESHPSILSPIFTPPTSAEESAPSGSCSPPPPPPPTPPVILPPPPPPLGLSNISLAAADLNLPPKKVIQTKNKLPTFNWTPVNPNNIKDSLFHNMNEEHLYKIIDFKDFEEKFHLFDCTDSVYTCGRATLRNFNSETNVNFSPDRILEANKLRNIAIARRRIGLSTKDLINYIQNLNLQKLTVDRVEILSRLLPTAEEEEQIREKTEEKIGFDKTTLSDDEKFILDIISVVNIGRKLKILLFIENFKDNVSTFSMQLQYLTEACTSIRKSQRFKKILEIILSIGNYMNSGKRGGVYGFKITCLDSLSETRSSDKRWSLLHFLAFTIQKKFPDLNNFPKDLHNIDKASAVPFENICSEIEELKRGMELAKSENFENRNQTLTEFISNSESKLKKLIDDHKKAEESFKLLYVYFGDNSKDFKTNITATIDRFIKQYKIAYSELSLLMIDTSNSTKKKKVPTATLR